MFNSSYIEKNLNGKIACKRFEDFIPNDGNLFPDYRVYEFMALGPFVLETEGAFETEYFYERETILNHDYLLSSGGETNQVPYLGKAVKNNYYGPAMLKWTQGVQKWGILRFDKEGKDCDDALYVTEQRNCVYYAASYIECEKEYDAVLSYETSGCKVFLNGEMIDETPYGRVKGYPASGKKVSVHFNKGKNLLMFKIRPGYIADGMDLCISGCFIYPLAVKSASFGMTYPLDTQMFFGSREKPLQMMQAYTWSDREIKKGKINYSCGEYQASEAFENIKPCESRLIRLNLPTDDKGGICDIKVNVRDDISENEALIKTKISPVTEFEGTDYLFTDFHFDTTYHQEQRTYAIGAFYLTKCHVENLMTDPDYKSILSEIDYLHPFYSVYPKYRKALKDAFLQGRAESDCFYNQPNELTSSGEGFVRNLAYGQFYHRDVLGRKTYIYTPGDVFGHPNQMTQIALKGGCDALKWGKLVLGLDAMFRHVSPDGTIGLHNKGVDRSRAKVLGVRHAFGGMDIRYGDSSVPNDGNTGWMKKSLNKTHFAVLSEKLSGLLKDVEKAEEDNDRKVDLVSRDLTMHHSGVLLTRTDFKQANRLAENLLITAEKFSSVAAYYGAEYPEKALDKAWRQILCAQHHDSITGTNNEISFVDLMIEFREAVELAAEIIRNATEFLASGIKMPGNDTAYVIFNPHAWERTDKIEVNVDAEYADGCEFISSNGEKYSADVVNNGEAVKAVFTAKVPAFGYETFTVKKAEKKCIDNAYDCTIENEFYVLTVDKNLGGGIVSLYDKQAKKQVIDTSKDGPANRIVVLRELGDRMETQHEIYTTGQKLVSSDYVADVSCEKCEQYQKLTVNVKLDVIATVKQEITLYKNVKRIDMKTGIDDYQGTDDLFALTFPVDVEGAHPIFDDRFAPHVWSFSQKKLSFQTHQYASFSHSKIAPVNQWIELGRTVRCVLPDADFNIGMTAIIRNPSLYKVTDELLIALSKKAIPVTPYSDTHQSGTGKLLHFNEDLDNTDTRFVLSIEGVSNEYEEKLLREADKNTVKEFNEGLNKNSVSVFVTKDSDNIYRKEIKVVLIKAKSENILLSFLKDISASLKCKAIINFDNAVCGCDIGKTENYGVALINKGNICCSVEPDNLMTMMLFHTAKFYGNSGKTTGEEELVPEQKTHCFSYSLYPHAGDYREAGVYKTAFEFNDSLISTKAGSRNGSKILPLQKSFISASDNFVLTSFKAGGYPSAQMKSDFGSMADRGFALRGFEIDGADGNAEIFTDFNIINAYNTDLLEENGKPSETIDGNINFASVSHSIETFALKVMPSEAVIGNAVLGATKEPVEPTYVRSWEHDMGSMNMGYLSVAGIIGKDVKKISDTQYRFNISMANNHPDTSIDGVMKLTLPDGFAADKSEIPYTVSPDAVEVYPVTVTKPSKEAAGIMRLNYAHDNQSFEDVYEFGYFNPDVALNIDGNKITVTVLNNTNDRIYGELSLATPFETWSALGLNSEARMDISPRIQKFDVSAGDVRSYEFNITSGNDGLTDAFYAVVKLSANGRIHFAYDRKKGARHNGWAHEFAHDLFERDKGSIKALLEWK